MTSVIINDHIYAEVLRVTSNRNHCFKIRDGYNAIVAAIFYSNTFRHAIEKSVIWRRKTEKLFNFISCDNGVYYRLKHARREFL